MFCCFCADGVELHELTVVDEQEYERIVANHLEPIARLFSKLDLDKNGYLDKNELKEVVARYNEEEFNEEAFFKWYDVNGKADGQVDIREFRWYIADVAKSFGDSLQVQQKVLRALISDFENIIKQITDEKQYEAVTAGHIKPISSLFSKLDTNKDGRLDKSELKEVVARYNGGEFNEAEFFDWFDVNGNPDGCVDGKEFRWYMADVAKSFGDTLETQQKVLPAILVDFENIVNQIADEKQYEAITGEDFRWYIADVAKSFVETI